MRPRYPCEVRLGLESDPPKPPQPAHLRRGASPGSAAASQGAGSLPSSLDSGDVNPDDAVADLEEYIQTLREWVLRTLRVVEEYGKKITTLTLDVQGATKAFLGEAA